MLNREHDLVGLAQIFRNAFETADLSDAPGSLPHFPSGCCSWATWMLGHYLKFEHGRSPFSIEGERQGRNHRETHAWLEVDDFTIDLTADQFSDSPSAVISTTSSSWHASWQINRRDVIEPIRQRNEPGRAVNPSDIYERVATIVRARNL